MKRKRTSKELISNILALCFLASGCLSSDIPTGATRNLDSNQVNTNESNDLAQDEFGAVANHSTIGQGVTLPPKVEIRHLIEPNLSTDQTYSPGTGLNGGGTYKKRLTLPKNFQGRLYVAGVNVGSLSDRHIRVRFRFGFNREPITIPATVVQAPGITPFTSINVLVLDMRSEPFRNVRLPYDLYDYNKYTFMGDTNEKEEPVQNNLSDGLYCRGLKVVDDDTFKSGDGVCDGLDNGDLTKPNLKEECLYAYAKIIDQGPAKVGVDPSGGTKKILVPTTPTLPQTQTVFDKSYYDDSFTSMIKKPLMNDLREVITAQSYYVASWGAAGSNGPLYFNKANNSWTLTDTSVEPDITYQFDGPYRPINVSEWEFDDKVIHGKNKLFQENSLGILEGKDLDSPLLLSPWCHSNFTHKKSDSTLLDCNPVSNVPKNITYFNSYLFPLATKLELQESVKHLSSADIIAPRVENTVSPAGSTLWMDGSNARVISRNANDEHIGSCNVSAVIEILARDANGNDFIIASAKDVKLQLVRPIHHKTSSNDDVLFTNFKKCASNTGCGVNECCFNQRCWDRSLVSQCFDESSIVGNKNVGETCSTDLDCSSLCCNQGKCAPHNTNLNPPVSCSKPAGNQCITGDWCARVNVTRCYIIRTGTDPTGNITCRQHCYTSMENGYCVDGRCRDPLSTLPGTFDPDAPGACDNAVAPPRF